MPKILLFVKDFELGSKLSSVCVDIGYTVEFSDENTILKTLNPLINSNSIWRNQAIIILEKYYFAKNEFEKSKQYNIMLQR